MCPGPCVLDNVFFVHHVLTFLLSSFSETLSPVQVQSDNPAPFYWSQLSTWRLGLAAAYESILKLWKISELHTSLNKRDFKRGTRLLDLACNADYEPLVYPHQIWCRRLPQDRSRSHVDQVSRQSQCYWCSLELESELLLCRCAA